MATINPNKVSVGDRAEAGAYTTGLGQPNSISGSEQHFGWIRGGTRGESDRRVGLNRMSKTTPDINSKLNSNPKPRTDRVVWAK